jgi:hypothetical protein
MKTSLKRGMLPVGIFLELKIPIPQGVSGLADEDICFKYVVLRVKDHEGGVIWA